MTYQFSSVDIHHMLFELTVLKGAKLDQIYQYSSDEFVFRFHKGGEGKFELRVLLPFCFFLTQNRPTAGDHFPFCAYLRKHVKGMYLQDISQIGFNRAVKFTFSFKDTIKHVIFEFFDKGNIIVSSDGTIIDNCLSQQRFKDRSLRPGLLYVLDHTPSPVEQLRLISQAILEGSIEGEQLKNETISKILATHCRLGGFYAKLVCQYANINPIALFTKEIVFKLEASLEKLFERQDFVVVDSKIIPAVFVQTQLGENVSLTRMSAYLSNLFLTENTIAEKKQSKKLSKSQKIIQAQEKQLEQIKTDVLSYQQIASTLQQHIDQVTHVVDEYNKGRLHRSVISEDKKLKTITIETDFLYE
jgi:predicted ribosome quality control (RQC) complex YloA/Tae2 family protein